MEIQIDSIKKENKDLQKKIRQLKNTQLAKSKELEICNRNKKYPQKIHSHTDEVKNLVAKKHDYFSKLTNNKKSLQNMKIYLNKVMNLFKDSKISPKFCLKGNELLVKQIEDEINNLLEELRGNEDEILEKALDQKNAKILLSNREKLFRIKRDGSTNERDAKQSLSCSSPRNNKKLLANIQTTLPIITQSLANSNQNPYKKRLTSKNHPYQKNLQFYNKNLVDDQLENILGNNSDIQEVEYNLNLEYDNTQESEYLELLKRKSQLENIKSTMEKNLKENEKIYEKKYKELINTIEHNQKKLKLMQQQNDLLSVEISDLTKILKLNLEEVKLKKEIKDSESKIYKSIVPNVHTNTHNDVSETRNEILEDLKNILIAEGEKAKNKSKLEVKLKDKVIQEENQEENTNTILDENAEGGGDKIDKILKCNYCLYFSSRYI
jgi:hypothetical protein